MSPVRHDPTSGCILTRCLEIQAAEHCNVRCAGCAQNSPFLERRFPNLNRLGEDLRRLEGVLHAERASVVGGEPLLNRDIGKLLALLRTRNIADEIVVTTNGTLLGKVGREFWDHVDVVEISLYPAVKDEVLGILDGVIARAWETRTELRILPTPRFRLITLTDETSAEVANEAFRRCYFKDFTHTLRDGRVYRCAPGTNIPAKVAAANPGHGAPRDAGFELATAVDIARELFAYLTSTTPLDVCRFCLGSSGAEFDHRMLTKAEVQQPDSLRGDLSSFAQGPAPSQ